MEHTQVKEIRELVAPDNKINTRPVEISLKVAELPTTTPIEVKAGNGKSASTVKLLLGFIC
jgi:protein O-GlcNAc transferase